MAELLRYELIVPREAICYLSWTIDAYEGIGFLRTDDPRLEDGRQAGRASVSILFSSDYRKELESLLCAFEAEGVELERIGIFAECLEDC